MSLEFVDEELNEHKAKMKAMRERQEAGQMATIEKHEAAMQVMKENQASEMKSLIKMDEEEISAAMQEFEIKVAARRFYHEAPNDVFELFVRLFSEVRVTDVDEYGRARGGLNILRLVSKRCLQVVDSVATRLTGEGDFEALPVAALNRCKRIELIACFALKSLEGCPDGLKSLHIVDGSSLESLEPLSAMLSACKGLKNLFIEFAPYISDLSPLSSCASLKKLIIKYSKVTDLSPLSAMTLLEELDLDLGHYDGSSDTITDLSSLSQFKRLKKLNISCHTMIKDLSPLSQCPDLEELDISIKDLSFLERGFTMLRILKIRSLQVDDLSPLINLQNLEELDCEDIPVTTTLLPLAKCCKLKKLHYDSDAMDLDELRKSRPDILYMLCQIY